MGASVAVAAPLITGNGNTYVVSTKTVAAASTIPASMSSILTMGYATVGDGGSSSYKRLTPSVDPGHAGAFQDASGAWFEIFNNVGIYRAEEYGIFAGVTPNLTALLNTALVSIKAIGGSAILFQSRIYRFATKNVIGQDGVDFIGDTVRARLKFEEAAFATTGIFQIAGTGVAAWNQVNTAIEEQDTVISNVAGSLAQFVQDAHIMVRSDEYYRLHIYDTPHVTRANTTNYAKGIIAFLPAVAPSTANGTWVVYTTGGITAGAQPAVGANPTADGAAAFYTFNFTDPTQQKPRPNSTLVNLGESYVTTQGYNIVCVTAGITAAAQPAGFDYSSTALVTDGAAQWRCYGYFNATRGELFRNAVYTAAAGAVTISSPTQLAYAMTGAGATPYTVQIGVPVLAKVAFRNLTIQGTGLTGAALTGPDSHGTYSTSGLDVGINARFTELELENVTFVGVEQFCVRRQCSFVKNTRVKYVFSTTRIESQQYGQFDQAAGLSTFIDCDGYNARHICDGDGGGANNGADYLRGVPQLIQATGGVGKGIWQTPYSGHRDCLDIQVNNAKFWVIAEGIKNRNTKGTYNNIEIYGPKDAAGVALYQAGLMSLFYYGGDVSFSNVRLNGGYVGFQAYDSDTFTSIANIHGDIYVDGAATYSARIGAAASDYANNIELSIHSANPVLDHLFIDGPCGILSFPKLTFVGGRNGITNSSRQSPITKLTVGVVNMSGLSGAGYDLYSVQGGSLGTGYIQSTTNNVVCDLGNCINLSAGPHTLENNNGANGWKTRSGADRITIAPGQNVKYTGALGDAYSVDNATTNSSFGFVNTNGTLAIGTGNTNRFGNSTQPTRTIAGGILAVPLGSPNVFMIVAPQGGAADDLDTITYAGAIGDRLIIRRQTANVTIKNATGNIRCGADKVMNTDDSIAEFIWQGAVWDLVNFQAN